MKRASRSFQGDEPVEGELEGWLWSGMHPGRYEVSREMMRLKANQKKANSQPEVKRAQEIPRGIL